MQIHSRPIVILQLMIFCILSPYYLHLSQALAKGVSILNQNTLLELVSDRYMLIILAAVSALTVWRMSSFAKWSVGSLVFVCLATSMHIALVDLNKIILILSFVYVITAYYLLMLFHVEIKSASYNPLYASSTIGQRSEYELPCKLKLDHEVIGGQLTNWDEKGCFVSFEEPVANLMELHGDLTLEMRLDGHVFTQKGKVVSTFNRGVGIRFTPILNDASESYNWIEYFKIIDDRGFIPRSRKV